VNIQFSNEAPAGFDTDLLVIGISSEAAGDLSVALAKLGSTGEAFAGAASDFSGKAAQRASFATLGLLSAKNLLLVGTGDGSDAHIRKAAGAAGYAARAKGHGRVALDLGALNSAQANAAVEGFQAGNYRFDKYKTRESDRKSPTETLTILGDCSQDVHRAQATAAAQSFARDLVNEPAAEIYPETLADAARTLAGDRVTVTVWDEEKILAERMGGIIAVGQGSSRPPRFIHVHYKPAGEPRKTIALVGKGVTFDSGGLSLKSSGGMLTMRCDMGGSAVVLGVMKAIAALEPDVEVHGIVGAVENMCAANSFKLGDILKIRNGKTVEVHNTDAEGRLVLADCLSYASELKPDAIVDFATLTGACVVALGNYYTGLFTNYDELADELLQSAALCDEGLWRMPLLELYKDMLKAEYGDIKNLGGRAAGSITAALFLSEFVEDDIPWAHCDVAGPAFLDKPMLHYTAGATGQMVTSVSRWICG
jgi:leucyl aminopeptidase